MAKVSAGLLLYRRAADGSGIEVLLGHMGGPFWARKDERAWSIVKGEIDPGEDHLAAARREFREETGHDAPAGEAIPLGEIRQSGGKVVHAWALEGDFDPDALEPGTFAMEWPPRSGRTAEFPELDRVAWFGRQEATVKVVAAQAVFVERLCAILG